MHAFMAAKLLKLARPHPLKPDTILAHRAYSRSAHRHRSRRRSRRRCRSPIGAMFLEQLVHSGLCGLTDGFKRLTASRQRLKVSVTVSGSQRRPSPVRSLPLKSIPGVVSCRHGAERLIHDQGLATPTPRLAQAFTPQDLRASAGALPGALRIVFDRFASNFLGPPMDSDHAPRSDERQAPPASGGHAATVPESARRARRDLLVGRGASTNSPSPVRSRSAPTIALSTSFLEDSRPRKATSAASRRPRTGVGQLTFAGRTRSGI